MKYFGEINSPKDLVTKEYVDQKILGGGYSFMDKLLRILLIQRHRQL